MDQLFSQKKKKEISEVSNLFTTNKFVLEKPEIKTEIPKVSKKKTGESKTKEQDSSILRKKIKKNPESKNKNTPQEIVEEVVEISRDVRTIFVGNVSLKIKKRKLINLFKQYGTIEKCWLRSIPVKPIQGKSIKDSIKQKQINESVTTANYYILFSTEKVFS